MELTQDWVDLGSWVGRQQAFALIATKCSAAQALSLKQVKESRSYEKLDLTWEDFCTRYVGIDRHKADRIIDQYQEFGDAYFRLSELARISPETYRQLAGHLENETIEWEGEKIPLTPENAPRIRAAIQSLRSQLRQARAHVESHRPPISDLRLRLDALLEDSTGIVRFQMPTVDRTYLLEMATYAIDKWTRLRQTLEKSQPLTPR